MMRFDMSDYNRAARSFWWVSITLGGVTISYAAVHVLRLGRVELLELAALTAAAFAVGLHPIKIPGTQTSITPGDVFVFLAVLLWGAPAATLIATADAAVTSCRTSKRLTSCLGGPAMISVSIFVSATIFERLLSLLHGSGFDGTAGLLTALLVVSLVYFFLNTFSNATQSALKRKNPVFALWWNGYRWLGLIYAAGASAAGLVYLSIEHYGISSLLAAGPLVGIILLACHLYFKQADEREKAIERISGIHLATVEALATAIDAKDEITADHVYRVQVYACGLARHFGLGKPEIEALKAGALLHDVGKIAVPDYILNKPGKLTAAEFDKMKIHTVVGAQIMERVNFPYPVVPIVRHHHERWDGRGYPDALKAEQIPLTARILTVADCFDAVREDRQYRKGMTREEACSFLRDNAGTQFDPNIVEAFLGNLVGFEEEIQVHKSSPQPLLTPTTQAGISERGMTAVPAAGLAQPDSDPPVYVKHIQSARSEASALYEMGQIFSKGLSVDGVVSETVSQLERAIPFTTCVFYFKTQDGGSVLAAHAFGANADRIQGNSLGMGQGIAGWVVINGRHMCNTDPMLDLERFLGSNDDDYRTTAVFPLTVGDETMGALALYSNELAAYHTGQIQLLESASRLTSTALHHAFLNEQAKASGQLGLMGEPPSGPPPISRASM
jgi:putative nucleotidyltransferase with HDIG domain